MKHPRLSKGVTRKALAGDEEVLMSPDGAKALIVNATGAVVVELCDGTRSPEDIAAFIAEHTPSAPIGTVQPDVERIIGELEAAGLLEPG
jgi:hypothetical protein